MTAHTTLRWGDSHLVPIINAGGDVRNYATKQLVAAHWRWPLSWNVLLIVQPFFEPGEAATFTVAWDVVIGVGQTTQTFTLFQSVAPPYNSIIDQRFWPAQDLQITGRVSGNSSRQEGILLGAFVAPQTEPHAMTELLEHARGARPQVQQHPQQVEWMPPGFVPEELGYRR